MDLAEAHSTTDDMRLLKTFNQLLVNALNCICVRAFFDAIRNTFNVGGRTSQQGLIGFFLVYVSGFLLLLPARNFLLLPPVHGLWSVMYVFALGFPLISLWIRRLHDCSWAGEKILVLLVLGGGLCASIQFFVCPLLLMFYFVFVALLSLTALVLCFPKSAEDNQYGPKPLDTLTTNHPATPYWNLGRVVLLLCCIGFLYTLIFGESCRDPFDG